VTFLASLGVSSFNVLFGINVLAEGRTEAFLGGALSIGLLATAAFSLPGGVLASVWGKKATVLLALGLTGAGLLGMATMPLGNLTLGFSFLMGCGQALFGVVSLSFLAENCAPEELTSLFSLNFSLFTGAMFVGSLLAGKLPQLISAQTALIGFALIELVALGVALALREERKKVSLDLKRWRQDYIEVAVSPLARDVMIYYVFIGLGAGLVIPFFNIFLTERLHATTLVVGLVLSLSQVGIAVAVLGAPFLARRYGKVRAAVVAQLLAVPLLLMIALPQSLEVVTVSFLLRSMLMNVSTPMNSSLFMELAPVHQRSLLASMIGFAQNASRAVSAAIGGWLMGWAGYSVPYFITAALYLLATVHLWRAFRGREQRGVDS